MSIHAPILRRLLFHPFRPAIVDDIRSYKGIELLVAAMHVAREIDRRSKKPHVGLLLPTSGAFPIAALGAWIAGRVVVPLNYLLKPDELQFVVEDAELDAVITVGPMLDFVKEEGTPKGVDLIRLDQMSFKGMPPLRWPHRANPDDLGVLLYTSGTSGKPKGVMLTHGNIAANIRQVLDFVDFSTRDVMLGVLPQFHSFGITALTLLPLSAGIKVVYTARFMPAKIMKLMRDHRPTILIAIPSMYNALLHAKDAQKEDFASLRYVVSGGEPLPQAVFDGFRDRFGVTINEGYGLTETAPISNWCRPHEFRRGSVGKPVGAGPSAVRERIVDVDTGKDLGPNQDGEVRIAGPNVMRGYFKREEETRAMFDEQGFLRTGDIGRMDDDGHLYITGRLKEMIIVGGENVFPREIEEVLNRHPTVKASGVVGGHDPMRGEVPVAFVEINDDAEFDERSIITFCREHLAGYKVPRSVKRLDALPRNPTGKVMRRELKTMV
ncbi:MAG: AMP-binding protein [Phycisphaeraceae bacterium]|nr:AMP-binding protein [Phycisphaeraceae bacterium]